MSSLSQPKLCILVSGLGRRVLCHGRVRDVDPSVPVQGSGGTEVCNPLHRGALQHPGQVPATSFHSHARAHGSGLNQLRIGPLSGLYAHLDLNEPRTFYSVNVIRAGTLAFVGWAGAAVLGCSSINTIPSKRNGFTA